MKTKNLLRIFGVVLISLNVLMFFVSFWVFPANRLVNELDVLLYVDYVRQANFLVDVVAGFLLTRYFNVVGLLLFFSSSIFAFCSLFFPYSTDDKLSFWLLPYLLVCYIDFLLWLFIKNKIHA
ncbi:hypothetical protein KO528_14255 [Saccharophagus degradans]|uniref:Uncharacterized protein n=1 Tax=Saccharophagus degradans TaxID=86304 RepID=A0AAW7XAM3_9GAMM|nr:hypothetical protein [Saccharophagus degradans]MBU2986522.1 hypothetical protein [Saccharophagus degradans]MDO6424712.1 hypothetical protein [Saccharophagus degradans]MDO6609536.1 hypothetical protein [Saccharophagus degradans]